jgi:hypothetical protein
LQYLSLPATALLGSFVTSLSAFVQPTACWVTLGSKEGAPLLQDTTAAEKLSMSIMDLNVATKAASMNKNSARHSSFLKPS